MGRILKFPVQATKLGYTRVRRRGRAGDHPAQLPLFSPPTAKILPFVPPASWFEQALALDERGEPGAADAYAKAIAAQDCVADAYCNLGILESRVGNTTKAFDCFTTALQHDPRHVEAHYNLGNLYFDVNDLRLARIHYEMAGQTDPSFANVYFNLALVQAISDDLAAAVRALTRYQELVPKAEGRNVEELLQNLKRSLVAAKKPGSSST